ncbi:hypothetical protein BASA84_000592 [Batrachochytrium salamandrivorans]|nr:hypothetical protein BASA84_000592 [Batrachochytrium salamandrivorans]
MRVLEGGCSVPLGVSSSISTDSTGVDMLNLTGSVTSLDGTVEIRHAVSMPMGVDSLDDRLVVAANIGQELAMVLTNQGAKAILDEIRHANNH